MMRNLFNSVSKAVSAVVLLYVLIFWFAGCGQPGETTAEGSRRHQRNLSVNQKEIMQDVDHALLLDEPSKLSDKKIP